MAGSPPQPCSLRYPCKSELNKCSNRRPCRGIPHQPAPRPSANMPREAAVPPSGPGIPGVTIYEKYQQDMAELDALEELIQTLAHKAAAAQTQAEADEVMQNVAELGERVRRHRAQVDVYQMSQQPQATAPAAPHATTTPQPRPQIGMLKFRMAQCRDHGLGGPCRFCELGCEHARLETNCECRDAPIERS